MNGTNTLPAGDLIIDSDRRSVTVRDRVIELTVRGFDLLLHLARNPRRVYTRTEWGVGYKFADRASTLSALAAG